MTLPTGTGGGTQREGGRPPSRPPQRIGPAHPGPALPQPKPVLFVTGHAPPDRIGAFARLHVLENVEFALFGGPSKHGGIELGRRELPFPHRHIRQHELAGIAASGRYRAVVCSSGGRVALGASWAGARRARVPLILWTSLWAHPRSAVHALSYLALRRLYRSADAVVTYGPHVSAYVSARGARNVHVAPQAVDNDFWSAPATAAPRWPTTARSAWPEQVATKFLFAGRPVREKGLGELLEAWRTTGLQAPTAALFLAGVGSIPLWVPAGGAAGEGAAGEGPDGVLCMDPIPAVELRNLYAACDVLVLPSIPTRTFREPWGLVVNEAMNQGLAVIASDAVGAAAGGLVRDGRNGLVVPAGDSAALAEAIRRLAADPALRARLGRAGAEDVRAFTYDAWAEGFSRALAGLGLGLGR
jgi:glycosyltransferase involved in cell wall biosynthesis